MSTYPRERNEFLNWCEGHTDQFSTNATSIGISSTQATLFKTKTEDMRAAVIAQTTAKDAARNATEVVEDAFEDLRETASDLIRIIRAFAVNSANPQTVYSLAGIPAPAAPQPVPPPGQPTDFRVELNATGSITIKWKASHPVGGGAVVYFVQRKLTGQANFSLIGGTGEKQFTDTTLPASSANGATYMITAQRGQVSGPPSQQLVVTFGVPGAGAGGGATLSFTTNEVSGGPTALAA